jgi:hypothetical protein
VEVEVGLVAENSAEEVAAGRLEVEAADRVKVVAAELRRMAEEGVAGKQMVVVHPHRDRRRDRPPRRRR